MIQSAPPRSYLKDFKKKKKLRTFQSGHWTNSNTLQYGLEQKKGGPEKTHCPLLPKVDGFCNNRMCWSGQPFQQVSVQAIITFSHVEKFPFVFFSIDTNDVN